MRVTVAHNFYASSQPSGENAVVRREVELLREAGIDIHLLARSSDSLAGGSLSSWLAAAVSPVYSRSATAEFARALEETAVDVLHVHNVYPLISPWILRVAKTVGIPTVVTHHNYRRTCINGLHLRNNRTCVDCEGRSIPWPGMIHACYRGSHSQSVILGAAETVHKNTWRDVDHHIALTPFMRDRLVSQGIPAERITVRPTSVDGPTSVRTLTARRGTYLLYVGRYDEIKGLDLLLDAWQLIPVERRSGTELLLCGEGPLRDRVRGLHATRDLGRQTQTGVSELMTGALAIVIPSRTWEGYPRVVAEAFAHGKPIVASNTPSLATIITRDVGWLCAPHAQTLAETLQDVLTSSDVVTMGARARDRWERELSPKMGTQSLIRLYESLVFA